MTNQLQSISKVPLLIGMDAEWGVAMRLDSVAAFPRQLTLGAADDPELTEKMGRAIGLECQRLGVHINFAPVVDVNNNPENPVIGTRAFGERASEVSKHGIAYMKGLNSVGVLANAKHFPGHGDTDADSHFALPIIRKSKSQLLKNELVPFMALAKEGLQSVMIAHLHIPSLDSTPDLPSTLSSKIVTDLLQEELGFEGLIFTDAMNMKGITQKYKKGERELMAFQAGADVLLFPEDVPTAFYRIKFALADGTISWERMANSVKKILMAKYQAGLDAYLPQETNHVTEDLNRADKLALIHSIYQSAAALVRDQNKLVPLVHLDRGPVAVLSIGDSANGLFGYTCSRYTTTDLFALDGKTIKMEDIPQWLEKLKPYHRIVIALHEVNNKPKINYGFSKELIKLLNELDQSKKLITVVLGVPYALRALPNLSTVLVTQQDNEYTRRIAASMIFGASGIKGSMPVTAVAENYGEKIITKSLGRLSYGKPSYLGFEDSLFNLIDSIMRVALDIKATPGAQVLIAKDGMVIWDKGYGYHRYDSLIKVDNDVIYDIASITKAASTAHLMMWLYEKGKIDIKRKISYYLPELKGTDKGNLRIEDILIHQAGLQPFIRFYERTLKEGKPDTAWYSTTWDSLFTLPVAHSLYARNDLPDSILQWVIETPLEEKPKREKKHTYKYSDMGFYLLKRLIERQIGQSVEDFLHANVFDPIGATKLGFKPLSWADTFRIAPTELDMRFRMQEILGTVHDPGAAMMGGVAGHAGVFSNANDLAKLMQMYLQGGYYGGEYYFHKPDVIQKFTETYQRGNRRGLIWDKPDKTLASRPTSVYASEECFGHTGFTGTAAWVDPKYNLVYIFLSNRIHPKVNNTLIQQNIRTRIHDVIYEAIGATLPQEETLINKD